MTGTAVLTKSGRSERRLGLAGAIYWGAFALLLANFFYAHHAVGLTYPVPWPDESSFLWPALAFRDTGSLYARELYEVREVFWMPPGYMVLSGIVFKLTGFSLSWARWLSALYLAGAMALLAGTVRASPARYGNALLIAVFSISPIAVLAGNTARMETLVCLAAVLGFALLIAGRKLGALGVLGLGPLVHPNGVFSLLSAVVYVVLQGRRNLKPRAWELLLLAVMLVCWTAYALHAAANWSELVADVGQQLDWKRAEFAMAGGISARLVQPGLIAAAALLVVGSVAALRYARHVLPLAALACGLLVQVALTAGWLYDLYAALLYLLVAIVVNEAATALIARRYGTRSATGMHLAASALLAAALLFAVKHDPLVNHSAEYASAGRAGGGPRYFESSDRARVGEALQKLPKPVIVQFLPDADSLLFHDFRTSELAFAQASFQEPLADVYVFHDSVWAHPVVKDMLKARLALRQGIAQPTDAWPLIASRDGTERWLMYRREPARRLP